MNAQKFIVSTSHGEVDCYFVEGISQESIQNNFGQGIVSRYDGVEVPDTHMEVDYKLVSTEDYYASTQEHQESCPGGCFFQEFKL